MGRSQVLFDRRKAARQRGRGGGGGRRGSRQEDELPPSSGSPSRRTGQRNHNESSASPARSKKVSVTREITQRLKQNREQEYRQGGRRSDDADEGPRDEAELQAFLLDLGISASNTHNHSHLRRDDTYQSVYARKSREKEEDEQEVDTIAALALGRSSFFSAPSEASGHYYNNSPDNDENDDEEESVLLQMSTMNETLKSLSFHERFRIPQHLVATLFASPDQQDESGYRDEYEGSSRVVLSQDETDYATQASQVPPSALLSQEGSEVYDSTAASQVPPAALARDPDAAYPGMRPPAFSLNSELFSEDDDEMSDAVLRSRRSDDPDCNSTLESSYYHNVERTTPAPMPLPSTLPLSNIGTRPPAGGGLTKYERPPVHYSNIGKAMSSIRRGAAMETSQPSSLPHHSANPHTSLSVSSTDSSSRDAIMNRRDATGASAPPPEKSSFYLPSRTVHSSLMDSVSSEDDSSRAFVASDGGVKEVMPAVGLPPSTAPRIRLPSESTLKEGDDNRVYQDGAISPSDTMKAVVPGNKPFVSDSDLPSQANATSSIPAVSLSYNREPTNPLVVRAVSVPQPARAPSPSTVTARSGSPRRPIDLSQYKSGAASVGMGSGVTSSASVMSCDSESRRFQLYRTVMVKYQQQSQRQYSSDGMQLRHERSVDSQGGLLRLNTLGVSYQRPPQDPAAASSNLQRLVLNGNNGRNPVLASAAEQVESHNMADSTTTASSLLVGEKEDVGDNDKDEEALEDWLDDALAASTTESFVAADDAKTQGVMSAVTSTHPIVTASTNASGSEVIMPPEQDGVNEEMSVKQSKDSLIQSDLVDHVFDDDDGEEMQDWLDSVIS